MTFAAGTRVLPLSGEVAEILANRKFFKRGVGICIREGAFVPEVGTITGWAGDYAMVRWDNDPACIEHTVHPLNLKAAL